MGEEKGKKSRDKSIGDEEGSKEEETKERHCCRAVPC